MTMRRGNHVSSVLSAMGHNPAEDEASVHAEPE
jgi:hypothetical protein